ncbi:MAG: nucleotidyl transferase AbiEii/AbiGii toxin family protein [Bacteroidetes bacterium]|nr:nucleotidyl transferase AbiEii/AbiGii toxin family protein [Bacteroidota bacterium]
MNLHENPQLFRQSIGVTAERLSILPIYIEKDYWVTLALKRIFSHPVGADTVFKGGTALSKCSGLIGRFSEDIDLVVIRREGETDSRLTKKLKEISSAAGVDLPEVEVPEITRKRGMNRKTAHAYPKVFSGSFGQVRDVIVIESTWFGHAEPFTTATISSFVYEMMKDASQEQVAKDFQLLPFEVRVLDVRRTFCEKIMSLVRFSYGENRVDSLRRKIRHTYDLHQLLKDQGVQSFFETQDFDRMLLKVGLDDFISFKNNNEWLKQHPKDAGLFAETVQLWPELKSAYTGEFKSLVYGEFPGEEQILATLVKIGKRLCSVPWQVPVGEPV